VSKTHSSVFTGIGSRLKQTQAAALKPADIETPLSVGNYDLLDDPIATRW